MRVSPLQFCLQLLRGTISFSLFLSYTYFSLANFSGQRLGAVSRGYIVGACLAGKTNPRAGLLIEIGVRFPRTPWVGLVLLFFPLFFFHYYYYYHYYIFSLSLFILMTSQHPRKLRRGTLALPRRRAKRNIFFFPRL